jgi:hypothetical protein
MQVLAATLMSELAYRAAECDFDKLQTLNADLQGALPSAAPLTLQRVEVAPGGQRYLVGSTPTTLYVAFQVSSSSNRSRLSVCEWSVVIAQRPPAVCSWCSPCPRAPCPRAPCPRAPCTLPLLGQSRTLSSSSTPRPSIQKTNWSMQYPSHLCHPPSLPPGHQGPEGLVGQPQHRHQPH